MKAVLCSSFLLGFLALTGCQSSDPMDAGGRGQPRSVHVEFVRGARIYEEGDAIYAMVNRSSRVLWFAGQSAELPVCQLKTGSGKVSQQNASGGGKEKGSRRFPLSPDETRYFEIRIGDSTGPISVGITFYPSLTGTNGSTAWSPPAVVPAKRPQLEKGE